MAMKICHGVSWGHTAEQCARHAYDLVGNKVAVIDHILRPKLDDLTRRGVETNHVAHELLVR